MTPSSERSIGRRCLRAIRVLICAVCVACSPTSEDGSLAPSNEVASARVDGAVGSSALTVSKAYAHEDEWPPIVALTRDWSPPDGARPIKASHRGALVRVTPDGHVRIDFGRHGVHEIPIEATDVVERMARVAEGSLHKPAPNFVLSVGTRLVDPRAATPQPLPSVAIRAFDTFVCVFADPKADAFVEIVPALSALAEREGVGVILFAQDSAETELAAMHAYLRSVSWTTPYAYPRLSPDHTRSLLGAAPETPTALLVSPNGRALLRADLTRSDGFQAIDRLLAREAEAETGT